MITHRRSRVTVGEFQHANPLIIPVIIATFITGVGVGKNSETL